MTPRTRIPLSDEAAALVETGRDRFVADLREAARIPSISSRPSVDLGRMADWIVGRLAPLLDEAGRVPVIGAADAVVGRASGVRRGAMMLYSHYDVQPPDPEGLWTRDAFGAEVVDGRVFARGVVDDKADIVARIHALQIWRQLGRPLPCDLVWLSEGAEEVGSPGLADLVRREFSGYDIAGCLWESYLRDEDGRPELVFGCRGLLYVELSHRTLRSDQHSSFASIARSATGELVRALAGLTDVDGKCVLPGFRDGIVEFSPRQLAQIAAEPVPSMDAMSVEGRSAALSEDDAELRLRFALEPTCNVVGISGGFVDEGMQTVLAGSASARLDFRLVPGQDPQRIADALRVHLDAEGYQDIALEVLAAVPPYLSSQDFPLAEAVASSAGVVMGEPLVRPIIPGTGPLAQLGETLGVPMVCPPGAFRMSSQVHAPDENVSIEDYLDAVRFTLHLLEELARQEG